MYALFREKKAPFLTKLFSAKTQIKRKRNISVHSVHLRLSINSDWAKTFNNIICAIHHAPLSAKSASLSNFGKDLDRSFWHQIYQIMKKIPFWLYCHEVQAIGEMFPASCKVPCSEATIYRVDPPTQKIHLQSSICRWYFMLNDSVDPKLDAAV